MNIKDIKNIISAVKEYLFSYEKFKKKFTPINNLSDLKIFIKERSAYVSQATLYGYLKTRMGLKTTLMFTDDVFIYGDAYAQTFNGVQISVVGSTLTFTVAGIGSTSLTLS